MPPEAAAAVLRLPRKHFQKERASRGLALTRPDTWCQAELAFGAGARTSLSALSAKRERIDSPDGSYAGRDARAPDRRK